MKHKRDKGFTLIELLVVIAIIALLLSIVVPSLRKARAHARKVIDHTNLRSLSMACMLYVNENNGEFFTYGGGHLWMERVGYYVDNINEVRYCPETIARLPEAEDTANDQWGESTRPWRWPKPNDPAEPYYFGSYGLNGWLYRSVGLVVDADQPKLYGKIASVRNPMNTPFILDANWVDGWPKNTNRLPSTGYRYDLGDGAGGNSTVNTMIGRYVMDRHGPETHGVFVDGQVKIIPHAELWTLAWHRGAEPDFTVTPPQPAPSKR